MRHEHGGNIYSNKCDIDFSANINPIGMGIEIKEAFFNSFDMSACYPDPECRELKKLVSEKENVSAENIICSNGAAELIFAVCFAMKPRKALIAAPCFAEYEQALSSVGCETEKYILDEKNGFAFDNGFISAIRNGIDIVFFTNPNNPTGNICDSGYVESIAAKCADCGATAVFDECFIDFVENGEKFTAKKYLNYGNMIILKAFTKFYAMPGLRLGYGMFSDYKTALKVRSCMQTWNVSAPAQAAGIAALNIKGLEERTLEYIGREKEYLLKNMEILAEKVYGHSANFIFFRESENFGKKMLERGILIRSCRNYYSLNDKYYRIAVRTHNENLKLIKAWKDIKVNG